MKFKSDPKPEIRGKKIGKLSFKARVEPQSVVASAKKKGKTPTGEKIVKNII